MKKNIQNMLTFSMEDYEFEDYDLKVFIAFRICNHC